MIRGSKGWSEDSSEEENLLRFERLVEELVSGGLQANEARVEAERRFGEFDRPAGDSSAVRSGSLGTGLRRQLHSKWSPWVVFGLASVSVQWLGDATLSLAYVLMPVSVVAGSCAIVAATSSRWAAPAIRAGRRALGLLLLLVPVAFLSSRGDWVHSLWCIQFPLTGLLLGSGLLWFRTGPMELSWSPRSSVLGGVAAKALVCTLALGMMPLLLVLIPFDVRPRAAENFPGVGGLIEWVSYGFGGALPTAMEPAGGDELARGVGVPPRIVTLWMGSTLFAALHWILFAMTVLSGRWTRNRSRSRAYVLIGPVALAAAAFPLLHGEALSRGLWRNEPWLVAAYGPTLLFAGVLTLALGIPPIPPWPDPAIPPRESTGADPP